MKVAAFMRPFFGMANGQAMRMFGDWVRNPETDISRHPEDYQLFYLGEFDESLGTFEVPKAKELLAVGSSFQDRIATAPEAREALRAIKGGE